MSEFPGVLSTLVQSVDFSKSGRIFPTCTSFTSSQLLSVAQQTSLNP